MGIYTYDLFIPQKGYINLASRYRRLYCIRIQEEVVAIHLVVRTSEALAGCRYLVQFRNLYYIHGERVNNDSGREFEISLTV